MKNWVKASVLAFLFSFAHFAYAGVVINEIMYDLDGGDIDWVEVHNPDSADVDLTTLKLLISNSTSNHSISSSSGGAVLHSGEYGVIVASSHLSSFNTKWAGVPKVFTSSYSLPNSGGKVEINDGDKLNPMSTLTYDSAHGGASNGKSLQKISDTWQESLPTPGAVNISSSSTGSNDETQGGNNTTSESTTSPLPPASNSSVSKNTVTTEIQTRITTQNIIFANLSTLFVASVVSPVGDPLFYGRYVWNFGDGDSRELKVREDNKISHIYFYPGDYTVTLEYYINDYGEVPDAMDSIDIKVISADVIISKLGDEKDFFIELTNNTESSVDISKWMFQSGEKKFTFPKNTVISSKKKITFSSFITGFVLGDKYNLKLVNQDWKTVFDYGLSTQSMIPIVPVTVTKISTAVPQVTSTATILATGDDDLIKVTSAYPEIREEALTATVSESNAFSLGDDIMYLIPLGFIAVASGAGVYYIRSRKRSQTPNEGEDFEISDE